MLDSPCFIGRFDVVSARVFSKKILEAREQLSDKTTLALGTSYADAWFFDKLKWGKRETELELNVFNVPIDLRGLLKTISPGYGEIFQMFLDVAKDEKLSIQFNYVQILNTLDLGIEFLKQCGLTPGKGGFTLGMKAATSHNFIIADDVEQEPGKKGFHSYRT